METKLTQEIIEGFEMSKSSYKPDYDDAGYSFTLPSGYSVEGFFMLNGESCEMDSLEGLDGYLYITTKEELQKIVKMTEDELLDYVESQNGDDFDRGEYE